MVFGVGGGESPRGYIRIITVIRFINTRPLQRASRVRRRCLSPVKRCPPPPRILLPLLLLFLLLLPLRTMAMAEFTASVFFFAPPRCIGYSTGPHRL
jgi:hypothetical protein